MGPSSCEWHSEIISIDSQKEIFSIYSQKVRLFIVVDIFYGRNAVLQSDWHCPFLRIVYLTSNLWKFALLVRKDDGRTSCAVSLDI